MFYIELSPKYVGVRVKFALLQEISMVTPIFFSKKQYKRL